MEFRLLGPVQAWMDQTPLPVGSRRQRLVLAALLIDINHVVAVERLVELLWQREAPPTARRVVQAHISRIRSVLAVSQADGTDVSLVRHSGGYGIRCDPMLVDVHRFHALIMQARSMADQQRTMLLSQALDLWRGPPLADTATEPIHHQLCAGLDEARLAATEDLFDAELRLGRHAERIEDVMRLVATHPDRQRLVGQLMLALYRAGRTPEALDEYRRTRQRLANEFGLDPAPDLRVLEQAILRADPVLDPPSHSPLAINQPASPAQLPADIPDFTGRTADLDQLDALLGRTGSGHDRAVVISAIDGTAGVGKTALAVHWGHKIAGQFTDGQLYIDLRGHATSAPIPVAEALAQLLRGLGVGPDQIPVAVVEAASLFRSLVAGRRVLLVLDNAADVEQVRPLLPGSSTCFVVVTSRTRLDGLVARNGASHLTLDVLAPDEAVTLLGRVLSRNRVDAEAGAAAELCQLCAYLPLAIRIAAANLASHPHQSLASYVAELAAGNRIAALQTHGDDRSAIRFAFDQSYTRLSPQVRRVFRLTGLVKGPDVTVPAIAALAAITQREAGQILERLAHAHLVREHAPDRFALHDLLRLYAESRVHIEEPIAARDAATSRLLWWYLRTADRAVQMLWPHMPRLPVHIGQDEPAADGAHPVEFPGDAAALAWLDAEQANLAAAVTSGSAQAPHPATWRLAYVLRGYFQLRRRGADWHAVAESAMAQSLAAVDPLARAAAHIGLGDSHRCLGRYKGAVEEYAAALQWAQCAEWTAGEVVALTGLGVAYRCVGQLDEATHHYRRALAAAQRTDPNSQIQALGNLAIAYRDTGRLAESAALHSQALAIAERRGFRSCAATALDNLGEVYHDQGQLELAIDHFTQALDMFQKLGDRQGEALVLGNLAAAYRDTGSEALAMEHATNAVAISRDAGDCRTQAEVLNTLASVHHSRGDHRKAAEHFREALCFARQACDRSPEVCALIGMAAAQAQLGEPARALTTCRQALELARHTGLRVLEGRALATLADIHHTEGSLNLALKFSRQALTIHQETGDHLSEARVQRCDVNAPTETALATVASPAAVPCGHSY